MPILESLKDNFDELVPEDKVVFLRKYRKVRYADLAKKPTYGYAAAAERNANIRLQNLGLTPDEIKLAKTLGLKPADILRLREVGKK